MKPIFTLLTFLWLCVYCTGQSTRVLRTNDLIVVTDLPEDQAKPYFTEFSRLRSFFQDHGVGLSPIPTIAFIPSNASAARALFPSSVKEASAVGMALSTDDQAFIVYPADAANGMEGFKHEASHALLRQALKGMPDWVDEGAAEFFSTAVFGDGMVTVGAAPRHSHGKSICVEPATLAGKIPLHRRDKAFYAAAWTVFKAASENGRDLALQDLALPNKRTCSDTVTASLAASNPTAISVQDSGLDAQVLQQDYLQHLAFALGTLPADAATTQGDQLEHTWTALFISLATRKEEAAQSLIESALMRFPDDPRLLYYRSKLD